MLVPDFDLHARHVDAGGTFALAALAADAQFHGVVHDIRVERLRAELAGERQPQRVGAAARGMDLVARDAIGRAHGARVELAAMAVVVAHLHRAAEAAPVRPVERGVERRGRVAGRVAEQAAVVHARGPHDLARIEPVVRIEQILDLAERVGQARTQDRLDPFRAHQSVAVLARERALVLLHQRAGFLGDRAHLLRAVAPHVEHRAHVQGADGRVRVPGAARSVPREHLVEALRVLREMLQRHRAVLDEGHRLAVALHRHHDVEAGLAHFPDVALRPVRP